MAPGVLEAVLTHAREARPVECCGVLIGSAAAIEQAIRAGNIASEPQRRFLVDPHDHFVARRRARALGIEVCGFYHSHPHSDAAPSMTDLADATYEGCLHLIVGLGVEPADVRIFRLVGSRFVEQRLSGAAPT